MADYAFVMPPGIDPTDDGTHSLPTALAQAMQYYGTNNSSPLPSNLSYPLNNQPGQSMFGGGAPMQFQMPQGAAPQPDNSPMAQAMAPQGPPQTPMSQAMGPSGAVQAPQSPAQPTIQDMLQNQATNPNLALNNSLISAGSALLGGKNLQEGLANAGQAFNDTYNKTLNSQRDLNTPKVTPVADGAFSMVQYPGQAATVVPSSQVQQFILDKAKTTADASLYRTLAGIDARGDNQSAQQTRAAAIAAAPKVTQLNQALSTMDQALSIVKNGRSLGERAAALSPTLGGLVGDGAQNQVLARVGVDSQLAQGAVKAGVVTQGQFDKFETDIPKVTDSDAVWQSYLERNKPFIESIRDFYQSQVDAGAKAGSGAVSGVASGGVLNKGNAPVRGVGISYVQ